MLARRYALRDDGFGKQKRGKKVEGEKRGSDVKEDLQSFPLEDRQLALCCRLLLCSVSSLFVSSACFVFLARDITTVRYEDPPRRDLETLLYNFKERDVGEHMSNCVFGDREDKTS